MKGTIFSTALTSASPHSKKSSFTREARERVLQGAHREFGLIAPVGLDAVKDRDHGCPCPASAPPAGDLRGRFGDSNREEGNDLSRKRVHKSLVSLAQEERSSMPLMNRGRTSCFIAGLADKINGDFDRAEFFPDFFGDPVAALLDASVQVGIEGLPVENALHQSFGV